LASITVVITAYENELIIKLAHKNMMRNRIIQIQTFSLPPKKNDFTGKNIKGTISAKGSRLISPVKNTLKSCVS
jgi:hypothetical protein